MDIPEKIKKWLVYDEKQFKYVLKQDTPEDIKQAYEEFLKEINDFILM